MIAGEHVVAADTISPSSPGGSSSIRSSTSARAISTSTPQIGWPIVPARMPKCGWLVVAVGEVSDSPYPSKIVVENAALKRLQHGQRQRRTARDAQPQPRQLPGGRRGLEQTDIHRRYAVEDVDLLAHHQIDRRRAGEPGQQHQCRAEPEGAVHADGLAERVEQRQAAEHHVVARASLASNTLTVAFITRLRWVSSAPLGSPVVPLV